jgi:hypothetical protein
VLPLAIDAENATRAAPFRFEAIESAIAADIEDAFSRQIGWQTLAHDFPGFTRVIHRLAHDGLRLCEKSVAQIDAMEPRFEDL